MRVRLALLAVLAGCGAAVRAPAVVTPVAAPAVTPPEEGLAFPLETKVTCSRGFDEDEHHYGLDLAAAEGSDVHAAADGVVVRAAPQRDYGRMVVLDHGGGLYTLYAHLREVAVHLGERVLGGELLGEVGHTGNARGNHLHFEVWRAPREVAIRPTSAIGIDGRSYRVDPARETPSPTCAK